MTGEQRAAVSGDPVDLETVTIDRLKASLAAFTPSFTPKELEFLNFRGQSYFIGYRPPPDYSYDEELGSHAERYAAPREHLIVSATAPERGTFKRFDDETMWEIVEEAMPEAPMQDATWLTEYDAYYYNQDGLRSLPVLRVRYADERGTWLYLDPQHGTMSKMDERGRLNRWLYHGFHSLDFPFLYYKRPLWDAVVILFSLGGIALTVTTLMPAYHRLMRHARRFRKFIVKSYSRRRGEVPVSGD